MEVLYYRKENYQELRDIARRYLLLSLAGMRQKIWIHLTDIF